MDEEKEMPITEEERQRWKDYLQEEKKYEEWTLRNKEILSYWNTYVFSEQDIDDLRKFIIEDIRRTLMFKEGDSIDSSALTKELRDKINKRFWG